MMITQSFDLNLIPDSAPIVVHCDQYDHGEGRLIASLYDDSIPYYADGSAMIQGKKPDGKGFAYDATISRNTVTADLTDQMTAVAGNTLCQIVVTESTGRTGSFTFILEVQRSALPSDTDMSESDYQAIQTLINLVNESVSAAAESAEDAEAWAVGQRSGVDVPSTDETYQNNSKYYAEQAQHYAQGGLHYKGSCLFANIPTSGMADGDMWNIEDDFTTDSRFREGAGKSVAAGSNIAWIADISKWDVLAMVRVGSLNDLNDVNVNTPTGGQGLVYDSTSGEWVNGDVAVSDMTPTTKGIGRPDGITSDVTNGVFRAKGVGIVGDVNPNGTAYGSDWLYYSDTTTVITPDADSMYRVIVNSKASLYYWDGTGYVQLASAGGGGGGTGNLVDVTTAQYNALTPAEKADPDTWYWINDMDGLSGSAIVIGTFAGLTDTNFTNLQNGQIPVYNSTTQKWENQNQSGGGVTSFNGRTGAVTPAVNDYSMAQLSDVTLSSLADSQILVYNATTQKWENQNQSGGGGSLSVSIIEDQAFASGVSIAGNSTERLFYNKPSNFIGFIGADPNANGVALNAVKNTSNKVGVTFVNLTSSPLTIYPVAYFVTATIS